MKKEYLPLYMRIKSEIIGRISDGELKKGDRLPSECTLAKKFKVSRITIVNALAELVKEGIIKKIRGSGSYIDCNILKDEHSDIFSNITSKAATEISFGLFLPDLQYEFMVRTLARIFQIENPDIRVNIIDISPTESNEDDIYLLKIRDRTVPTVGEFFLHADYASVNALVPLENLPGFTQLKSNLYPQCCYKTENIDGEKHIHAIASKVNSRVIMINTDMLEKAGINDTSILKDLKTLKYWVTALGTYTRKQQKELYGVYMGIPSGWHDVISYFPYLWGNNKNITNNHSPDSYKDFIKNENFVNGLSLLAQLYNKGNPAPADEGMNLFALGRVGIVLSTSAWLMTLNPILAKKMKMKVFQIPSAIPQAPTPSVMGSYSLGIFRSAVKKQEELDAAWKWIKFLLRKQQQFLQSVDYSFPAVKDIACAMEKKYPDETKIFTKSLLSSIPQFDFYNIRKALSVTGKSIKKCLTEQTQTEKCVEKIVSQLENI